MEWPLSNHEAFLFSEDLHDVVFEFVNKESAIETVETLPAHSQILAFASEVFRTQLFGVLQERTIKIEDANSEDFKVFLRFIYTGELNLCIENMFEMAYLAKKYLIEALSTRVYEYFKGKIWEHENFWELFNPERIGLFDDEDDTLLTRLLSRFEDNATELFDSAQFLATNENIIDQLVRCELLKVKEFDIYKAIVQWAKSQCKTKLMAPTTDNMRGFVKGFLHSLRLPTLKITELTGCEGINTNNLLTEEEKTGLLCYVGGQFSAPVPFEKMPRLCSSDLFCTTSSFSNGIELSLIGGSGHSVTILNATTYRLVGVVCVITTEGSDTPAKIVFELRSSLSKQTVYSFEWVSEGIDEVHDLEIICMLGDVIPIYAHAYYTIVARPSEDVSMNSFQGQFVSCGDQSAKVQCTSVWSTRRHVFKSLYLLEM